MDNDGSTLERLRRQLAGLESAQRASGGIARPDFWKTPPPGAAGPGSWGATWPGSSDTAGPGSSGGGDAGGASKMPGALAPTLAFAADITALPDLKPTSLDEADLFESVTQLGHLQHHREVVLVRLVSDIETRALSCPGGLGRVDWLRSLDPTLTVTAAKAVVTCAAAFNEPRWQWLRDAVIGAQAATGEDASVSDPGKGAAAVGDDPGGTGRVTVGKAAQVIDFHARLKPVADPDDLDQAVAVLTEQSATLRPEDLARLARELSDQVRPPKNTDDLDQKRRDARGLWFLAPNAAGMVGVTGTLDPEGAAIIKAAIDPLSCPCPLTDEAGGKIEDDPRPAHQRRMDALIEIVARGVSSPGHPPRTEKAKIVVTIDLENLREHATHPGSTHFTRASTKPGAGGPQGSGRGGGSCMTGDVVTAATVRRWACDAAIIPVVLGSDSQPLDIGRQERLVTRPMRTLLWLRDKGCTFPGCSMPAQWTDAHHVRNWINGGETATSNLALLCRRHHVYVHDKHLTATITDTGVTWHTWQHWRTTFTTDATGSPDPPDSRGESYQPPRPNTVPVAPAVTQNRPDG